MADSSADWIVLDQREGVGRVDTWDEYLCVRKSEKANEVELAICRHQIVCEIPREWFDDDGQPLEEFRDEYGDFQAPEYIDISSSAGPIRTAIIGHDGEYLLSDLMCDETYGLPLQAPGDDVEKIQEAISELEWAGPNIGRLAFLAAQLVFGEPYLDCYEVDGQTRWNWKQLTGRASERVSQEFLSEESAIEARKNNELLWEAQPDFG